MAKKRRDKEHDSSSLSKVTKVGAAALTIGVGAAAFNNSALSKKMVTNLLPSANKAGKVASKHLRDSKAVRTGLEKRTTGKDIKEALTLGKKTFKETSDALKANKKLRIDNTRKNSFHGAVKHFEQIKNSDVAYQFRDKYKTELMTKNIFKLINDPKYKDKDKIALSHLAQEAYAKIEENTLKSKDGKLGFTKFLSKRFKANDFSDQEEFEFLSNIYKSLQDIEADVANSKGRIQNATTKLHKELDKTLLESTQRQDKLLNKLSKFIKDKTEIDVDLEQFFMGSKAATLGEVKEAIKEGKFEAKDFNFLIKDNKGRTVTHNFNDVIKRLEGLSDDIIFDNSIRIDKDGNLFSDAEIREVARNTFKGFSDTTLGKIFGLTDVRLNTEKASFTTFRALSTGKEAAYEIGNESTILTSSKVAVANPLTGKSKLFNLSLDEEDNLIMSDVIAEGRLRNNMHGKSARLIKEMVGTNKDLISTSDNEIFKTLDLGQSGAPGFLTKLKSRLTAKDSDDYSRNILKRQKRFYSNEKSALEKIDQAAREYLEESGLEFTEDNILHAQAEIGNKILRDNQEVANMLNSLTAMNQITDESISSLLHSGTITSNESLRILEVLNNKEYRNAEELLSLISNNGNTQPFNQDLKNILTRGLSNSDYISSMQNISQINSKNMFGYSFESTNVMNIEDIIRREAVKEVMLRESYGGVKAGISNLENVLQNSNLSLEQSKNLRYLANWSIMQKNLDIYNDIDAVIHLNDVYSKVRVFDDLMTVSGTFREGYTSMIDDLGARARVFENTVGNINQTYINEYNNYTFLKESALSRLTQIQDINDAIKIAGEAGKELIAGRNDLNNYTTLTQIPQFMVARLSWGVESLGLNLSKDSTSSTLDYIKNIGLKRILPAAGALALYDYLDFESENFTGVSITGAGANALANVDKASRRLAYATGVGQAIDWFKETSVIADYWTGSTDFQTLEEREDWYENGYSAVRSGRLWGFGSSNEFRGGNIQYWQPNYVKRAHSNYHDVSVYGSTDEKYKHSWIPSLRHPLSPLRAMWDPYWLEKKNMEERPYPLTGKMFSEGTLWGAILNPTVGEILKPVRMLPEVKQRLGSDGRDIRNVLRSLNDRIKHRGKEQHDVLIFEGTDIRNARYYSYGNVGDNTMNINIANGKITSPGIDYTNNLEEISKKVVPTGKVIANSYTGDEFVATGDSEIIQEFSDSSYEAKLVVNEILAGINSSIKAIGKPFGYRDNSTTGSYTPSNLPDRSQGTYVYTNLINQMNQRNLNYYDSISNAKMVDKSLVNNYLKDASNSMRELSGIYNFLGELAFGEDSYSFRYADASSMTSFSRQFWDAGIGGFGGEFMEIARRFFPSEDKSIIRYNPLRNSMPEWLPERFLTGDPFISLPKGEMRLPGRGYETLNDLHADQFGEYGAFDRFKILADIAPTSEEYKLWRNIARNTVTDPNLIAQMDEIQSRASKQSGKHEFYDYRYIKNNVEMKKGVVKSINGSIVELATGEHLNLGGITLNKDADMSQILQVGQHIHYRTAENAIKRLEDGLVTNAVIYKKDISGSTNINKTLISMGMAEKNKDDRTAIGYLANASSLQQTLGSIQELIGHANIPFLHNKWMKIETARESFLNEQVYGSPFTTWDHPIKGFVRPALNNTSKQGILQHGLAVGSTALFMNIGRLTSESYLKYLAGGLAAATNPSALLGMTTAGIWNLGVRATNIGKKTNLEVGAGMGATIGSVAWAWNNAENPFKAAAGFALAGHSASQWFKLDEIGLKNGKGALIGATIGLTLSAIKNPRMTKDMFRSKWIPKETEERYELDEYFDRLEYIKYKGLYNQAAFRATLFEGSNIKSIMRKLDKNKAKVAKLNRKAEKLSNKYVAETYGYQQSMQKINNKIQALESQQTILKGGKYTKAAVAYKKAMESTIYGLSEGATQDEILASVPDQYKDYFMNFMNETNEKERKKILKALPEYLRKPLQVAWNDKVDKVDSNKKFFKHHKLPGMAWRGWKPNVNLKHVKMKTIQNEGMLLSDFGYYESEKSKMQYHMAPTIKNYDINGQSGLMHLANMTSALSGLGMSIQNISVEPTSSPGLWIVGDIKQTASDVMKVGEYGITSGMNGLTSLLF